MAFQAVSYLKLSVAELHRRLEQSTVEHDRSEKLISFYLVEMNQRKGYQDFGYANIYDYALGKFGFAPRRTRYYLSVGKRVGALPNLTEAVLREDLSAGEAVLARRPAPR